MIDSDSDSDIEVEILRRCCICHKSKKICEYSKNSKEEFYKSCNTCRTRSRERGASYRRKKGMSVRRVA